MFAMHSIGCPCQSKQTICHSWQTEETAHNFHAGEADTCRALSNGELQHWNFPCQQPTNLLSDKSPSRRSEIGNHVVGAVVLHGGPKIGLCCPGLRSTILYHQQRYQCNLHHRYVLGIGEPRFDCGDPKLQCFHRYSS